MSTTRRAFLTTSAAFLPAAAVTVPAAAAVLRRFDGGLPDSYPTNDSESVRELVLKAHFDVDTVRAMVTERPELAKAAWDWGFGDWESALGAASHMGRLDIAEALIEQGARPNLYTFAMLGQVDVVRAVCEANPGVQRIRGPHGITLLQHAKQGKERAASVVEYLEELGDADIGEEAKPLSKEVADGYVGDYEPRDAPGVVFRIKWHERNEIITIARDDRQHRFLKHRGDHRFSPGGAPSVRVRFSEFVDDRAARLTIRDGGLEIIAARR